MLGKDSINANTRHYVVNVGLVIIKKYRATCIGIQSNSKNRPKVYYTVI